MPARDRWRIALALGMAVAGLSHLFNPLPFVQHLPEWVPARYPLIYATGLVEIALGAALVLGPRATGPQATSRRMAWRRAAGRLLALYLLAVWPANVYVAVAGIDVAGQPDGVYPWVRVPLQVVFVWLALWSTAAEAAAGSRHPEVRRGEQAVASRP